MFYNEKEEKLKAQVRYNKVNRSPAGYSKTAGVRRKLERQLRKLNKDDA